MREILFRGKRIDNGEWLSSGNLITFNDEGEGKQFFIPEANAKCTSTHDEQDNIIAFPSGVFYKVDPDTIGQYTGRTDKNSKKIFEGDILPIEDEIVAVVIFKDGCFRMEEYGLCGTWTESGFDECGGGWGVIQCDPIDWYTIIDMEVIGNIHDNPELLEVTAE